jgi:hypothetical protein
MQSGRFVVTALTFACAIVGFFGQTALAQTTAPSPAPTQNPCAAVINLINRPTLASSPCAVSTNHVLVESGYANVVSTGPEAGVAANYPQAVIRIGTFDPKFEFDIFAPNYTHSSLGGANGWSDFAVGTQFNLGQSDDAVWGGGAIVWIPTGDRAFTAGGAQFTGDFNWVYNLGPVLGLFGTESVNALSNLRPNGNAQSYFAFIPSNGISAGLSASSVLYGEYTYYSQVSAAPGSKSLFDFGYEQGLGSHIVLDVEYGFSPPGPSGQKQHYVGAGLSFMN